MTYSAEDKLRIARISLQKQYPFYAYLSMKLNLVENPSILTAGVDGKGNLYYAPEFILPLNTAQLAFLWAHEVCHLVYEHLGGKGARNHIIWNMACDFVINGNLDNEGLGEFIKGGCLDHKYDGWTSAQVYVDLMKDAEKNAKTYADSVGDNHEEWGDLSEGEAEELKREWTRNVVSAAHAAKQAGGEVPEAFRGLLSDLTENKIDWRDLVREKVKTLSSTVTSFNRVDRRRKLGAFNFPGKSYDEDARFAVAIDVSGSFTQDMVTEAMSEVYYAAEEFSDVEIDVLQWDTRVYGHRKFSSADKDEMFEYKIEGGGGTNFHCVIDWLRNQETPPKQLFVFTDLEFSYMEDPMICDTTFIVIGNKTIGPYGDTVQYS